MPTGFMHRLHEGEQTFEEFVLRWVSIGWDYEYPPKLERVISDYGQGLEEAEKKLNEFKSMSFAVAELHAKAERDKMLSKREEEMRKVLDRLKRYRAMLSKIKQWQAPPECQGLKDRMIVEIEKGIREDCCSTDLLYLYSLAVLSGEEWRQDQIEGALEDIAYYTKHNLEQIERIKGRNAWLTKLYESLDMEVPGES